MPTITEVRQRFPQYNDLSDADLADALHAKFYSDMSREEFAAKMGGTSVQPEAPAADMTALEKLSAAPRMALQGATLGFGDEAQAALAALPIYALKNYVQEPLHKLFPDAIPSNKVSLGDAYNYGLGKAREGLSEFQEEHPVISTGLQIAGAVGTGGVGAKALQKFAPGTSGAIAKFAAEHPYYASAGIGGGTGALYGFGAGEGGFENRAANSALGGVIGSVAGPGATFLGRNVVAPLAERTGSALKALGDRFGLGQKTGSALATIDNTTPTVPESAPQALAQLEKPSGDYFSKTVGQRTQSAKAQTLEQDAIGGRFGVEASSDMRKALNVQNDERHAFVKALSPKASSAEEVNDVLDGVYQRIQGNAKSLGAKVTNAYDIARQGNSVKIGADDLETGLMSEIGRIRGETGANLADGINYSKARAVMDALAEKFNGGDAKVKSIKLGDLEDWRKTLTGYANDATGTEKAFLSKVRGAYDDFMIKTANEAADIGDQEAIMAFRNAVSLRKQYGDLFEKNKIVESVAEGKSADDFVKDLIGSGSIAGKKNMLDNAKAIVKAGGDEAEAVKSDMATAFAKRMYKRAIDGKAEGQPDKEFISARKLMNELDAMFIKNRDTAEFLYGKESIEAARKAIKELDLISTSQPATKNPSGSGYMIARVLRDTGVTRIPGLSLVDKVFKSAEQAAGHAKVAKSLTDFIDESAKPVASFWSIGGGLGGGAAAGAMNQPLTVVVQPNSARGY